MFTRRNLTRLAICALLLAGCTARTAPAADAPSWPRFHGPKGDNISLDTGLLKKWPEDGPKLLWKAQGMGEGFASVAIANGLIYTDGNIDDKTVITAMDLDGKVQWTAPNGEAWTGSHPGTRGTPTIDGDRLYLENPLGQVGCFDAKTGKEIWQLNVLKEFGAKPPTWALAESLVIDGDHVLCTPGGPETAVVALDKATGKVVWKSPTADKDPAGYCTPAVIEYQGLRIILTMTGKALIGVNADDGALLFRYEHPTRFDINVQTPIFHDGQIYITSGYGSVSELLKLSVDGKKAEVAQVWKTKDLDNHHGGVVLVDGYLYGSAFNGKWMCLDWKTGKKLYSESGVGKGSLTSAEGMLYTLSEKDKMGLVKATPDGHKVISQFDLPKGGEGPSWAHPVVCGGRLYIRHGDFLYVYAIKAE
jgi:outer membrane protein assembly factor BamB